MPKIFVRCGAPDNRKIVKLAKALEIEVPHALGLCVGLWEKVMQEEHFDANISEWDVEDIALACRTSIDPEKLKAALLHARLLEIKNDALLVHDWPEEQGEFIKQKARNMKRPKKNPVTPPLGTELAAPAPPSDDVVRLLLQSMKQAHTRGGVDQKREAIAAWRARGIKTGNIELEIVNHPGLNLFEIEKILIQKHVVGTPGGIGAGADKVTEFFAAKAKKEAVK